MEIQKIFLCLIILHSYLASANSNNENSLNGIVRSPQDVLSDLPTKYDLVTYVAALGRIIDFFDTHKYEVDMSVYFGLIMIDVNLKNLLFEKQATIEWIIFKYLKIQIKVNENLITFFKEMAKGLYKLKTITLRFKKEHEKILRMLVKDKQWMKVLRKFNSKLLRKTALKSSKELHETYGYKWDNYVHLINDRSVAKLSDQCLSLFGHRQEHQSKCVIPEKCHSFVKDGNDFGYELSHRLLFILMARMQPNCVVFSKQEDDRYVKNFCSVAFEEMEYIALNDYKEPDLLAEIIAFCSLDGHAQFIRRSWLKHLLALQDKAGCFIYQYMPTPNITMAKEWMLMQPNMHIGKCLRHFTATAAAALASATRYILETYY